MALAVQNLGSRETLESLANENRFNTSFGEKVGELLALGYTEWRRIRGDGNCFYRSVGYGWLEEIINAPAQQQRAWAQNVLRKLESLHFDSPAEQIAHQRLIAHVGNLAAGRGWQETSSASQNGRSQQELLEASFMDDNLDLALVRALRTLIGQYLIANADDDIVCNGISFRVLCTAQGQGSPEDFCRTTVLRMGVEAETQILRATVQALEIRLEIVLLDREADRKLCFENYDVIGGDTVHPLVHVQIRPGHYDLICRNVPEPEPGRPDGGSVGRDDAVEECQRYFCRECACPFVWRQGDKPTVRCESCGHSICVLCLAEASRPRSMLERAVGLRGVLSKGLRQSGELVCPHVAAQLEKNDHELNSLKVQLQQDSENWAGTVDVLEDQFQLELKATERAEARMQEALDQESVLAQRCQGLEQAHEELLRTNQQLEGRCHELGEKVALRIEEKEGLSQANQQLEGRCQVLEQNERKISSSNRQLEITCTELTQNLQQEQGEALKQISQLGQLESQVQQRNAAQQRQTRCLLFLWAVLLAAFLVRGMLHGGRGTVTTPGAPTPFQPVDGGEGGAYRRASAMDTSTSHVKLHTDVAY